ncbi:Sodium/hydrogen exchanger family-domain-containing protein, partial [Coemansia spiralis]
FIYSTNRQQRIKVTMAGGSSSATIIAGRNPIQYSASNPLPLFIVQLLIIVCLCRFLHLFLKRIYQPTVISEVIGGIILGPTVLSRWTAFQKNVFPTDSLAILTLVSNFGLVLFLFMVGLELDPKALKRNLHRCVAISAAGMLLPFGLGVAVSYAIYKILMDSKGSFVIFLLFTGVAMAITAFPVLARILTEQNLLKTTVGSIAISAASIDDVVSWCLLALVIALTNNATGLTALWVFLVGAGYVLFILFVVRPIYCWYLTRTGCLNGRDPSQTVLFITFMMVLVSAFFTDIIGIHPIFGGFIIGVIVPHSGGFAIKVTEKIEDVVQIFFLPIYFVLSGLKTNLSDLSDGKTWGLVILVCAVAFIGKIGGCTLAARFSKYTWRESLTIGFLMNCKGLVELIVLNIGLDAGVIDVRVFSLMVVMALVTTCATSPMVVWLYPLKYQKRIDGIYGDGAEIAMENDADSTISRRHGPDAGHPMNMLVVLSKIQQVPAIMTLLSYLHHQPELTSSRMLTANENGTNAKPLILESLYRPIKVFGLRLLEYTGRDSSIMTQYQLESQVLLDPAMAMFRAFARVANMVFHSLLAYSERERFVDSILSSTKDTNSELTVV